MKMNKTSLKSLGLSDMEAQVYLATLELGEGTMQALAKKSGVNRSTIYTFIDGLKERGFIVETKRGKRRMYSATDPSRLVEMQKVRIGELQRILPELLAIHNLARHKPRVTFHEGVEGIKEVYADMLHTREEILAYEDIEHLKESLPEEFYGYFPKERARKGILLRSISRDSLLAREFVKNNRKLLRQTKFINSDDFRTDINIYKDKVVLMSLRSEPPFAVLIEDKSTAQTMRIIWNELWKHLGPVVE